MMSRFGLGLGGLTRGSRASSTSIISASMRLAIPQSGGANLGTTFTTNNYVYQRYRDFSVKAVNNTRAGYFNGGCWFRAATTFINGWNDIGSGATVNLRGSMVIDPTSTGMNGGGTTFTRTYVDVSAQASLGSLSGIDQFIYKLDNSGGSPAFTAKTYAQFVADGGSVVSSTVNGGTLAASRCVVPDGYVVISDKGPSLAAKTAYYAQMEEKGALQVTLSTVTAAVGSAVLQLAATPDTAYAVGGSVNISGATGNTTVNGVFQITAIDAILNTITVTNSTINVGVVGGTVLLKANKFTGAINPLITTVAFGDAQKVSATELDIIGKSDWSAYVNGATEGAAFGVFAFMIGEDPTNGQTILLNGDSIAYGVGDRSTNAPSGNVLQGDAYGGLGWGSQMLNALSYPYIKVAVPSMKAQDGVQKGDDLFRRFLAGFCDVMLNGMGHNDSGNMGTYLPTMNSNYRVALRGVKRVVQTTFPPTTGVGTSSLWSTAPRSLQTQSVPWTFPAGAVYATFQPAIRANATYNNDAYIDLSVLCGNLDGTATVDGYWPVDGTNYKYTVDGTHPSKDGHAGVAGQLIAAPATVAAALGF